MGSEMCIRDSVWCAGDVLYFPPISASAEFLFNIDSGTGIPAYPSGESGIKGLRIRSDGLVFWGDNNDVPIAGRVGAFLVKTGENDTDYAFDLNPDRILPALPAAGSRDNMIPKFDGDTLGWEPDATGSGSTDLSAYRTSAAQDVIDAQEVTDRTAADDALAAALGSENSGRTAADAALGTRIDNLPVAGNRVEAISNWEAGAQARTVQLFIYPPAAIPGSTALRFTIQGMTLTANSGAGIDTGGAIIDLAIDAAAAANIDRNAARNGNVPIDWIHTGGPYHAAMDYIPAPTSNVQPQGGTVLFNGNVTTTATAFVSASWTTVPTDDNAAFMLFEFNDPISSCLLYTSPSPRDS